MNITLALRLAAGCVFDSEGYRSVAYLDTLPRVPVWTIGHGSTLVDGKAVHEGMTCTRAQADNWAMDDLRHTAYFVLAKVRYALNECQLGALTSFAYNIGCGGFERSTVCRALNAGFVQRAADALLDYDEAGGQAIRGLYSRREHERTLFMSQMTSQPAPALAEPVAALSADELNGLEIARLAQT